MSKPNMFKKTNGMTLLEMMAVVALIATLSALAFPSYQRYIEKANLVDAKYALASVKHAFEAEKLRQPRRFTGTNTKSKQETRLKELIQERVPEKITSKYKLSISAVGGHDSFFHLIGLAIPKDNTKDSVWIGDDGTAYRCKGSQVVANTTPPANCQEPL